MTAASMSPSFSLERDKPAMTSPAVHIHDLSKIYVVSKREAGMIAALKSLVNRGAEQVHAVDGISFDLAPGEIVGFLGPNGAGKTPR
jgi:ABC-2 type transport system ATP-binding protein